MALVYKEHLLNMCHAILQPFFGGPIENSFPEATTTYVAANRSLKAHFATVSGIRHSGDVHAILLIATSKDLTAAQLREKCYL